MFRPRPRRSPKLRSFSVTVHQLTWRSVAVARTGRDRPGWSGPAHGVVQKQRTYNDRSSVRPIVRRSRVFIVDGGRVECGRVAGADHKQCTVLSPAAYAIQSTTQSYVAVGCIEVQTDIGKNGAPRLLKQRCGAPVFDCAN